jgi:hypothetical protein
MIKYIVFLVTAVLAISGCSQHNCEKSLITSNNRQNTKNTVAYLRSKYEKRIIINPPNKYYTMENLQAMDELLQEWNPVGATIDDLKQVIPRLPNKGDSDEIIYYFFRGIGGTVYIFKHDGNKIVSWKKEPLL